MSNKTPKLPVLLPCVGCGSTKVSYTEVDDTYDYADNAVYCNSCLLKVEDDLRTLEELGDIWNNMPMRFSCPGIDEDIDTIKEALKCYYNGN